MEANNPVPGQCAHHPTTTAVAHEGEQLTVAESALIGTRITAALHFAAACADDEPPFRRHVLWEVRNIMRDIDPEDMTTPELAELVAGLIPAHGRVLNERTVPGIGKVLRLVTNEAAADIYDEPALRRHLLWEVRNIMRDIDPEDLSTTELAGLVAVLIPAHGRVLNGASGSSPRSGKVLRLVPHDSAANLAE